MNLKDTLNNHGLDKEPFFFIISFDLACWEVIKLSELEDDILYNFSGINETNDEKIKLESIFVDFEQYKIKFDKVQENIKDGNTYLLNLTQPTKVNTNSSLKEIYKVANAKFKVYYKDKFVSFSPERFIEIINNKIYTYPMKGTIDANIPNAKQKIIEDEKELAEHTMAVDLLRNDLSIVSSNVKVEDFRYCDKIQAGDKQLLQISSKISGELKSNWHKNIGDILTALLPAGSITGTPKCKTVKLIKEIENYDRDFFTGICGVFDGESLDSCVMIRFIEKQLNGSLLYKSGGGITADSDIKKEYQEMCDKVYVP